jgi:UPF0716 protein FxsA
MLGLLALVFLVVPIVELYVVVQVAQSVGVLPTLALIVLVSAAGAWLCRREGVGVYRRVHAEVSAGRAPGASLVDAFLILFGGALLMTPGFVTDALGLALLLPPVRMALRALLIRRFARKARKLISDGTTGFAGGTRVFVLDGRTVPPGSDEPRRGPFGEQVIDVGEATYGRRPGESPGDQPRLDR